MFSGSRRWGSDSALSTLWRSTAWCSARKIPPAVRSWRSNGEFSSHLIERRKSNFLGHRLLVGPTSQNGIATDSIAGDTICGGWLARRCPECLTFDFGAWVPVEGRREGRLPRERITQEEARRVAVAGSRRGPTPLIRVESDAGRSTARWYGRSRIPVPPARTFPPPRPRNTRRRICRPRCTPPSPNRMAQRRTRSSGHAPHSRSARGTPTGRLARTAPPPARSR